MTPIYFRNMLGKKTNLGQLIEESLNAARIELFTVRLSKEAITADENKSMGRIARLEREEKDHAAKREALKEQA